MGGELNDEERAAQIESAYHQPFLDFRRMLAVARPGDGGSESPLNNLAEIMKLMAEPYTEKQSASKLTESSMPGFRRLKTFTRKCPNAQLLCLLTRLQRTEINWRPHAILTPHGRAMLRLIDKWGKRLEGMTSEAWLAAANASPYTDEWNNLYYGVFKQSIEKLREPDGPRPVRNPKASHIAVAERICDGMPEISDDDDEWDIAFKVKIEEPLPTPWHSTSLSKKRSHFEMIEQTSDRSTKRLKLEQGGHAM